MRKDILLEAEKDFYISYPEGINDPEIIKIKKKHNTIKLSDYFKKVFEKQNFDYLDTIIAEMIKIIQRSTMVSLFEKPKFRDFVNALSYEDKDILVGGLYSLLYEDQEQGFNQILFILQQGKLAKWTLISAFLYYSNPTNEVFCKPTTMKNIIKILEIDTLKYSPKPSYKFYCEFRDIILEIKSICNQKMGDDNAGISGFLMMMLPNYENREK